MKKQKTYQKPTVETLKMEVECLSATSGGSPEGGTGGNDLDGGGSKDYDTDLWNDADE